MQQCQLVLDHMKQYGSITPKEAMDRYGIMRLGARIWDLRQNGHDIIRAWAEAPNRYGETTRFAKYSLRSDKSDNTTALL